MQGLMLVLSVLVLTNACLVTVTGDDRAIEEARCGADQPVLKGAMSPLASGSPEPTPSAFDHLESFPLHVTVDPPSPLARHIVLTEHCMQDNLQHVVQVFLC
jgi:hypothetical protein